MHFASSLVNSSPSSPPGFRPTNTLPGLAESSFYPGMQYVIGSWYRKDELAKRSCIFHVSSAIATMCSGYLMASVYHLGGRGGFAGWQWFVILRCSNNVDAKTRVQAIRCRWYHFSANRISRVFLHPRRSRDLSRILSEYRGTYSILVLIFSETNMSFQDRAFAKKRMQLEGRKPRAPYTRAKIRRILTSWHIYALTALYV